MGVISSIVTFSAGVYFVRKLEWLANESSRISDTGVRPGPNFQILASDDSLMLSIFEEPNLLSIAASFCFLLSLLQCAFLGFRREE